MSYEPEKYNPYGSSPQYAGQPSQYDPYGGKPNSGSGLMWLWILLGGGGLVVLVCCGSCCGLAFWGMEQEEPELQARFANHPTVVEKLGGIDTLERNWSRSIDDEDTLIWYFDVTGPKGSGTIVIREGEFDWESEDLEIEWARLEMQDGEAYDIYP